MTKRRTTTAVWVSRLVWEEIRRYRCARGGGPIIPSGIVFSCPTFYGKKTGATPDGRRRCAPLADSAGPSQGRDRCGPTGVIRSEAKLPPSRAATCAVLSMKFARPVFESAAFREKALRLFQSYFRMGGMQPQVTVANRDKQRAA